MPNGIKFYLTISRETGAVYATKRLTSEHLRRSEPHITLARQYLRDRLDILGKYEQLTRAYAKAVTEIVELTVQKDEACRAMAEATAELETFAEALRKKAFPTESGGGPAGESGLTGLPPIKKDASPDAGAGGSVASSAGLGV